MRTLILAIAAAAALALLPATTLADPVEVLDAATEELCSEVYYDETYTEGGCALEAESIGNIQIAVQGSGGVPVFNGFTYCSLFADVSVGGDGRGVLSNIVIAPGSSGSSNCGVGFRECHVDDTYPYTDYTDLVWPIQIQHDGSGNRTVVLTPCLPETVSGIVRRYRGDLELDFDGSPTWEIRSDNPTWFTNQSYEYLNWLQGPPPTGTRGMRIGLDILNGEDVIVNDL